MKDISYCLLGAILLLLPTATNAQREPRGQEFFSIDLLELSSKGDINRPDKLAHYLAKIGDHRAALTMEDSQVHLGFDTISESDKDYYMNFKPYPANDAISEAAKDFQVLMINESHANPQHRVFTKNLLEDLYKHGYRYLF